MAHGKFIVLEGGEGAGKSSVAEFLKARLPKAGSLFTPTPIRRELVWGFTREPGGTPLGELIRAAVISPEAADASAETQFGLIWAARFEHIKKVIQPALTKGVNVLSERFDSATYAYQVFGQEALHLKPLFLECRKLLGDCVPNLYILLDVLPSEGLRRAKASGRRIDHFEQRDIAFHTRVRAGLNEFLQTVPHIVIDANRPLKRVQQDVLRLINRYVPQ